MDNGPSCLRAIAFDSPAIPGHWNKTLQIKSSPAAPFDFLARDTPKQVAEQSSRARARFATSFQDLHGTFSRLSFLLSYVNNPVVGNQAP